MLAHAMAKQDRAAEARDALRPALEYYRREQEAGASGLTFRRDFAYALYVSALAEADDPAGRARKDQALGQAAGLIAGTSAEARRLVDVREVSDWIAAARGSAL
jgi:hypothetical protein